MTFKEFVRTVDHLPPGQMDFVRDARQDPDLPSVRTWNGLENYLIGRGACAAAIQAARRVWNSYAGS